MKKTVLVCLLAAVALPSIAEEPGRGHYDVKFLKNGREILADDALLSTSIPFLFRDGHEVSEVTCIYSGGMKSMKSEQRFIGVVVRIARRVDDPRQADVQLEDTHLVRMDESSNGDCATLSAKTDGLQRTSLSVRLPADQETINVPVGGGEYILEIRHRID